MKMRHIFVCLQHHPSQGSETSSPSHGIHTLLGEIMADIFDVQPGICPQRAAVPKTWSNRQCHASQWGHTLDWEKKAGMHIPSETIWNVSDANMSFPPSRVNLFNVQSLWKKPCSNSPAITGHRVWLIKPLGCTGHLISRSRTCCNQYSMCKIHILWTCGYMYTHGNEFLSELIHISPYGPWDNPPDPIPWCKGLAEVIMDATLTRLAPLGRDLGTGPPKGAQPIPPGPTCRVPCSTSGHAVEGTASTVRQRQNPRHQRRHMVGQLAKCRGTTGRLWVGLGGNWKQMKTQISCNVLQILSRNISTIFAWHLLTLSQGCKQLPKMLDKVEVMAGFTTLGTWTAARLRMWIQDDETPRFIKPGFILHPKWLRLAD